MTKRVSIIDSLKWIGILTLAICFFVSDASAGLNQAGPEKSSTVVKTGPSSLKAPVAKVGNLELIYADGGVRVRVHTGSRIEFSHQIEPAKNGKPYRIILDCLNSNHNLGAQQFRALPVSVIKRIRTSQFAVKPQPITRIVLDLGKEAFYRVEQKADYIDLFVTDRKAKRFTSWSSAGWLASQSKKSSQKTMLAETPTKKSAPAKSIEKKSSTKSALASKDSAPKIVAPAPKVTPVKLASHPKAEIKVVAKASTKKAPAKKATQKKSVSASKMAQVKTALPVKAKRNIAKTQAQPEIVIAKASPKSEAKKAVKKPVIAKVSAPKTNLAIKTSQKKKPVAKQTVVAAKKTVEKPAMAKASTPKTMLAAKKPAKKMSVVKPSIRKAAPKLTSPSLTVAKSSVSTPATVSKPATKKKALAVVTKKADPVKKVAPKKQVVVKKSVVKTPAMTVAKVETKKPVVAKKKQTAKSAKAKSTPSTSGMLASSAKSLKAKSSPAKKDKALASVKVAKKQVAKKESSKGKESSKDKANKKKAAKKPSSLFATVANAASADQDATAKAAKERQYKAQYRRSMDQRRIKLKGAQVAEFPKRLTIKYKTHGTRDPFGTLLAESSNRNDGMMNELPNVEALTMVGILRDTNGKTRGLFEDIDGRGYILSKGDKVRNGTVLKVTKHKAYFQIFEYGWSRTVALSLEG